MNDRHHLIPRSRGGEDLDSNLIHININRHRNWHRYWRHLTLDEVIKMLQGLPELTPTPIWTNMWGTRTLEQVIILLKRIKRIKDSQKVSKHLS